MKTSKIRWLPQNTWRLQAIIATIVMVWVFFSTYLQLLSAWGFNTDDAYITLRYSHHLAQGHGIVWNIGEVVPVEGYSNFFFVLLGAWAETMGWEPIVALKIICSISLYITCVLLYFSARLWAGPIVSVLPAMSLTAYKGTTWWTVSGLETAFFQMIAVAAILSFFLALGYRSVEIGISHRKDTSYILLAISGFLVFIAGIVRPEGPIIGIALGAGLIFQILSEWRQGSMEGAFWSKAIARTVTLALAFAIPYGIYFAWRYNRYGLLFPNTVYTKADYQGNPTKMIEDFWFLAWPFIFVSIAQVVRKFDTRYIVAAMIVALYMIILYGVDPIIGHYNRHFLAAYAILLITTAAGVNTIIKWTPRNWHIVISLSLLAIALVWANKDIGKRIEKFHHMAIKYDRRMDAREKVADWMNVHLTPNDEFLIGDAGYVPYLAKTKVIDAYGLNSLEFTQPPISRSGEAFVAHVLKRRPAAFVLSSKHPEYMIPHKLYDIYPSLLANPDFTENYVYAEVFGAHDDKFQYWIFKRKGL